MKIQDESPPKSKMAKLLNYNDQASILESTY